MSNDEADSEIESSLLACYDIAGNALKKRIEDGPRLGKGECAVVVDGFNVYAGDSIDGRDRQRIERMCRYLTRPPIAMERLTKMGDEDLRYELKKAWKDGTRFVMLDPHELVARICAMVPPPRFHRIRFRGILAPNSALREQVVASARPYVPPQENTAPNPVQLPLFGKLFEQPDADVEGKRRKPWAWLLRHVDPMSCMPACDGAVFSACDDSLKFSFDCAKLGLTCDLNKKGCTSSAPSGPTCDYDNFTGSCKDGAPLICTGQGQEKLGPKCADYGLTCGQTDLSDAVCTGTGAACVSDSYGSLRIDYSTGVSCNGTKLTACVADKEAEVDCTTLVKGTTCQSFGNEFFCGLAAECDPTVSAPTCEGDSVVVCNAGRTDKVDCKSLGFTGCNAKWGRCSPSVFDMFP